MCLCMINEAGRGIHPGYASRPRLLQDNLGKGAGSTSDVQPIEMCWQFKPPQKILGDKPAPTTHIGLVELAGSPRVLTLSWHNDLSILRPNAGVHPRRCRSGKAAEAVASGGTLGWAGDSQWIGKILEWIRMIS